MIASKPKSKLHLQRSWAARLEYRRQTAARTTGAEHQIQHRTRLAKERAGQKADRIGEIGVIERIEGIHADFEGPIFSDSKFPAQRQIELGHSETWESVPPQIALRGGGSRPKRGRVDAASAGHGWVRDPEWLA